MTTRAPFALLLLGAVATVAAVAWWFSPATVAATASAVVQDPPRDPVVPQAYEPEPRDRSLPPLEEVDGGLSDDDLWAYISDPANSNLPPDVFAKLTQLGAEVVRADATGVGRDRWPGYWNAPSSGRNGVCCTEIEVHGAGAFATDATGDAARVTVVWTMAGKRGGGVTVRVGDVLLRRGVSGWRPERM